MSLPTCYGWWGWSWEVKHPAQSGLMSHRAEQTTWGFWFRVHRSFHCAHHAPPSHISLGGAGVLFSSSDGRAEVRNDKPQVTQLLSVKTGIQTQFSQANCSSCSWLCHFPGRHKSSVVFITHCWHLPLLRDHHTSMDPYTHTWVYTKPKQKVFLTNILLPYTLLSILF